MFNYNEIGHVCPETGRVCITVEQFDENYCDVTGYLYSIEDEELGFDPWRLVEYADACLDHRQETRYELWFLSCGGYRKAHPDDPIYVSAKAFAGK